MALSRADMVKKKKKVPELPEKNPQREIPEILHQGQCFHLLGDSKEDQCTSVYSDFTPTWASSCFIQINHWLP